MRKGLLSILCFLMMSVAVLAHNLEPLHVDGRYLKNSKGDIVTLHGYMTVLDPWFQVEEYSWEGYDVATCLKNKKAVIDRLLASGWKMDYVRFGLDSYWFSSDQNDVIGSFAFERFKKYFEEVFLPLIDYFHEKGIYTLLWPQQGTPEKIEIGDEFQEQLLLMWDYVSSHPRIRNNPGVMFELSNEPVYINFHQYNYLSDFPDVIMRMSSTYKNLRDYFQPIVDRIRSYCDNIIYIPGLFWQSAFSGFSEYPVEGGNIGYSIHLYYNRDDIRKDWEEQKFPVAYMAPIIMTENVWYGGADSGKTSNFGDPLKRIVDELGNMSWNCYEPYEDFYYLVNSSSSSKHATKANDPEACFLPMFQWWNEYAKNKTMPTSHLKAKSVSFDEFPTFFRIGQKCLAKLKAEFTNGMTWDVSGDAEYIVADESILSINHGVIRAKKEGSTTVTVKYTDGTGQTFSRQFEVTSTLFPLTKKEFNANLQTIGSFDEATGTFSSTEVSIGGWSFDDGLDLSQYKNLVVQLNEKQQCDARLRIWDINNIWSENEAYEKPGVAGFGFGDATELVIDLQSLHKENGEPLDLSHIYNVGIWIASGSVSIKRVFLSNDGVATPYQEPLLVYADNKVMYYGDKIPALTFYTSRTGLSGTPKLSTTATSSSPVGSYPVEIERGSVTNKGAKFIDGGLTIFKATLNVGAENVTIYESEDIPEFALVCDGLKNGDSEDNAFIKKPTAWTSATNWSEPGTYPILIDEGDADNYSLYYSEGTLTIKKGNVIREKSVFAVEEGQTFPSGTTVSLPAVSLTFGEAGGPDFIGGYCNELGEDFSAYTPGNNVNGDKAGGTFYVFSPTKDGELTIGVQQNHQKKLFIEEDGVALPRYNGVMLSPDDQEAHTLSFPVKAGHTYKLYASGSKLGFYGFVFRWISRPHGDVNGDGVVDAADIVCLVNMMMHPSAGTDISFADLNGDKALSDQDIAIITNIILKKITNQ